MTDTHLFASLLVSGVDARQFLQGQLSADINTLTRNQPLLASVNSAQGRVQAVLTLIERDEGIVVSVISVMAERTMQRLQKYVLRSKVKLEWAATVVSASVSSVHPEPVEGLRIPSLNEPERFDKLNVNGPRDSAPDADQPTLLAQLRAGIPHVFPETHEAFVAQMLNLDLVGGISFEKGCYTGQEIIARTHFRGAVKRRMFRFAANCSPPPPATRLLNNGEHAGDVVYAAATEQGCELLAVVSLAQADAALTLEGDAALTMMELPYAIS